MGLDTGPDAGGFEPKPIKFFSVYYPATDFGERKATPEATPYCSRYFRWSKIYGTEQVDQGQTKASQTVVIEVRRDRVTDLITTNMQATWNGLSFGITNIQPKPFNSAILVVTLKSLLPVASVSEPSP